MNPISEAYFGDQIKYMKQFPDKFFDLVIADPSYGINAPNMSMGSNLKRKGTGYPGESTAARLRKGRLNSGGGKLKDRFLNKSDISWDNSPPKPAYFKELFRVSKNQIIWGGNYFKLPPSRCIIVWDKIQPWDNFSQVELAWTSFDKPTPLFRFSNRGGDNKEIKIHPTQKPVFVYRWILSRFANEGWKILDPGMGSQSSRIAAWQMGFDYYGSENDKQYFHDGCKRFEFEKSQAFIKDFKTDLVPIQNTIEFNSLTNSQ